MDPIFAPAAQALAVAGQMAASTAPVLPPPAPEPGASTDWTIHLASALWILAMMVLYNVGIVLRAAASDKNAEDAQKREVPLRRLLAVGFPVSLLTIGGYGATAVATLDFGASDFLFKALAVAGNVVILGMLSQDSLKKLLAAGAPSISLAVGPTAQAE